MIEYALGQQIFFLKSHVFVDCKPNISALELAHTLLVPRLTLLYVLCSVEEREITTHTR
jgi:hypothetical protein